MFFMNARQYNEHAMKGLFRKVYPLIACQVITRTGIRSGVCIDLGGGPGMLGICLAEASDLQVVIVDPLPECVELAHENIAERNLCHRVTAQAGQAEVLGFPDDSVDLVASRGSIFFWGNQLQSLSEIYRVLRPGGWAYIGGGFGSNALRDEIISNMSGSEQWAIQRNEQKRKRPPGHFQALLQELKIHGEVESGDSGTWIVFCKPESFQDKEKEEVSS